MFTPEIETRLAVYRAATDSTREDAIARVLEIGLTTWETHPHYMRERVCGRVCQALHN